LEIIGVNSILGFCIMWLWAVGTFKLSPKLPTTYGSTTQEHNKHQEKKKILKGSVSGV
jgi:hypothetical protein